MRLARTWASPSQARAPAAVHTVCFKGQIPTWTSELLCNWVNSQSQMSKKAF